MSIFRQDDTVKNIAADEALDIEGELSGEVSGYQGKKKIGKWDVIALILSVIAAVFLWFYVMSVESPTAEVDFFGVSVSCENAYGLQVEKGWSLLSSDNYTVDVVLRGKKSTLNRMTSDDVTAFVDLLKVKKVGTNELPVEFSLPDGVTCITTRTVQVEVDALTSKTVPVEVQLTNYSFDSDYEIGEGATDVSYIVVSGPASIVDSVASAKAVLDMKNQKLTESFEASVTPVLCDADDHALQSNYLSLSTHVVNVSVPVTLYKKLPLTVSYKYGYFSEENVNVKIEPAEIRIKGEPGIVAALQSVEIAEIDETTVAGDISSVFSVSLPEGVSAMDGVKEAKLTLQHFGTSVKTITIPLTTVIGGENKHYQITPGSIDVQVRCKTNRLNSLTASSISATIDLSTVEDSYIGTVDKKVTVNVEPSLIGSAYILGEYSVTVELSEPVAVSSELPVIPDEQ